MSTKKAPSAPTKKPTAKKTTPLPTQQVRLAQIDPSPFNRTVTDISDLVASVRDHGVQQAIKLRPLGDRFEIVYGERRYRAAKEVGLTTIPATIEDLSEEDAHELRVIENTARKDLHPIEAAESWELLLQAKNAKGKAKHTPQTIARAIGRSVREVYHTLKLNALVPELRAACRTDKLSVEGAFLIARAIPADIQLAAWELLEKYAKEEAEDFDFDSSGRLTPAVIQDLIDRHFTFALKNAPFPLDDAKLACGAGSCEKCPKRSCNQAQLFGADEAKDICLDHACYQAKHRAHLERIRTRVRALGGRVMTDEESKKVFAGGSHLPWNSPWVRLEEACEHHPDRTPWRELLGDLAPAPVLALDGTGRPVELADKSLCLETLKKNGVDFEKLRQERWAARAASQANGEGGEGEGEDGALDDDGPSAPPPPPPDPAEQRLQTEVKRLAPQRVLAALVTAAESAGPEDPRFLKLMVATMLTGGFHDAVAATAKRREIKPENKDGRREDALKAAVQSMSGATLRGLALELCLSRTAYFSYRGSVLSNDLQEALATYGLDGGPIVAAVESELREKQAQRTAKKAA